MKSRGQELLLRAVADAGVRDARVLQAFREVARAHFVPTDLVARAYEVDPQCDSRAAPDYSRKLAFLDQNS